MELIEDRIGFRLKYAEGVDRRLLVEARDELVRLRGAASGEVGPGEVRAWLEAHGVKLVPWQVKRLEELAAEKG